jgi:hypothetical protein
VSSDEQAPATDLIDGGHRDPPRPALTLRQLRVQIALTHAGLDDVSAPDDETLAGVTTVWLDPDGHGLELAGEDGLIVAAWHRDVGPSDQTIEPNTSDPGLPQAWSALLPPWCLERPRCHEVADSEGGRRWRLTRIAEALEHCAAIAGNLTATAPMIPTAIASSRARRVDLLLHQGRGRTIVELEVTGVAERVARLACEEIRANLSAGPGSAQLTPDDGHQRETVAFGIGVRAIIGLRLRANREPLEGWSLALA